MMTDPKQSVPRGARLVDSPVPHLVVRSRKQLHGWWPGRRACTSERLLLNPYNGCSVGCLFCYSLALPGYFSFFRRHGIPTVFEDFDREVARQLDGLEVATCGYLSPVADPFQPLENKYGLSQRIIDAFVSRNLPIEFITKEEIPPPALDQIKTQQHSFGQVSILTIHEPLRRQLMRGGATTKVLFENLRRLARAGVHAVCRVDPVIPGVTDDREDLRAIVRTAADAGARHVVASCMDIPVSMAKGTFQKLGGMGRMSEGDLRALYNERIGGYLHASLDHRRALFEWLSGECDTVGVTFALCMEYEEKDGGAFSLNPKFASSSNCEGIDVPAYRRRGSCFEPAAGCNGNCLACSEAACGIEDLALGRIKGWEYPGFGIVDYRRWSRKLRQKDATCL